MRSCNIYSLTFAMQAFLCWPGYWRHGHGSYRKKHFLLVPAFFDAVRRVPSKSKFKPGSPTDLRATWQKKDMVQDFMLLLLAAFHHSTLWDPRASQGVLRLADVTSVHWAMNAGAEDLQLNTLEARAVLQLG